MKKSMKCPKCESVEIYYIPKKTMGEDSAFHITAFLKGDTIEYTRYVCASCGYMEDYVTDIGLKVLEKAEKDHLIHKLPSSRM